MPRFRHRSAAFLLGLPILAIGLSLAAVEGTLRVAGVDFSPPYEPESIIEFDSILGWRKQPHATRIYRTKEYASTETTNSLGLRGPEYSIAKREGTRRILLLGDSFANAYPIPFDSTVGQLLERALNRDTAVEHEVINGGTVGYSTDQELLFFRETGRRFEPDITILFFYSNDVWFNASGHYYRGPKPVFVLHGDSLELTNVPIPRPAGAMGAPEFDRSKGLRGLAGRARSWLSANSRLYALGQAAIFRSPRMSGLMIRLGKAQIPPEWRAWKKLPDPQLAHAWKTTEALLASLKREASEGGGHLIVFYVPTRSAVYDAYWRRSRRMYAMSDASWSPTQDARVLNDVCRRQRLDCIIPVERFRMEARRLEDSERRLYFRDDPHWNPIGHSLAAEILTGLVSERLADSVRATPRH